MDEDLEGMSREELLDEVRRLRSGIHPELWGLLRASDFRRIALSMKGAEEGLHMGQPDFRVGGRIFATLASEREGYGNLMLTPEQQADFVSELPEVFVPIKGGWGGMGMTHIVLEKASEDLLTGALQAAWKNRVEKNVKGKNKNSVKRSRLRSPKPRL